MWAMYRICAFLVIISIVGSWAYPDCYHIDGTLRQGSEQRDGQQRLLKKREISEPEKKKDEDNRTRDPSDSTTTTKDIPETIATTLKPSSTTTMKTTTSIPIENTTAHSKPTNKRENKSDPEESSSSTPNPNLSPRSNFEPPSSPETTRGSNPGPPSYPNAGNFGNPSIGYPGAYPNPTWQVQQFPNGIGWTGTSVNRSPDGSSVSSSSSAGAIAGIPNTNSRGGFEEAPSNSDIPQPNNGGINYFPRFPSFPNNRFGGYPNIDPGFAPNFYPNRGFGNSFPIPNVFPNQPVNYNPSWNINRSPDGNSWTGTRVGGSPDGSSVNAGAIAGAVDGNPMLNVPNYNYNNGGGRVSPDISYNRDNNNNDQTPNDGTGTISNIPQTLARGAFTDEEPNTNVNPNQVPFPNQKSPTLNVVQYPNGVGWTGTDINRSPDGSSISASARAGSISGNGYGDTVPNFNSRGGFDDSTPKNYGSTPNDQIPNNYQNSLPNNNGKGPMQSGFASASSYAGAAAGPGYAYAGSLPPLPPLPSLPPLRGFPPMRPFSPMRPLNLHSRIQADIEDMQNQIASQSASGGSSISSSAQGYTDSDSWGMLGGITSDGANVGEYHEVSSSSGGGGGSQGTSVSSHSSIISTGDGKVYKSGKSQTIIQKDGKTYIKEVSYP